MAPFIGKSMRVDKKK